MAGGINNFSPMIGNNATILMKSVQQLISANPDYLTKGIPNNLIHMMWNTEPVPSDKEAKVMTNSRVLNVSNVSNVSTSLFVCYHLL